MSSEWRPIESAPMDGTPVIIAGFNECGDGVHRWSYAVAKWNPSFNSWVGDKLEITGCWETGSAWFEPGEVSHWTPLPEPPSEEERETSLELTGGV